MYENDDEEEENMSFFLFFEIVCKLEKTGAKKRFADIKNWFVFFGIVLS